MNSSETRRLAAIMFTDIVGFSRQMGADEARMLRLLDVHNQLIRQAVAAYHGHVIKTIGDAFLVDFPSVVHAVQCAQQVHAQLRAHNVDRENAEQIHVRIGIHLGDVVQKDGDVFGDGVNIASRLQSLAEPDTICISQAVYKEVEKKLALGTVVSLGKPKLKNIVERFQVYALLPAAPTGMRQKLQVQRLKLSHRLHPAYRFMLTRGMLVAGILITIRYLLVFFPHTQHPAPDTQSLPLPDKPSIVVLPFTNMSNDSSQDYFSDGITEDITTDLSKIASLFVISRNSAFTYKGKATRVQEISREMGVRYVLEGSVRRANDQVRITAQLIDATQDRHLWAERYDRPLTDIFAVQDEIVQQLVTRLRVEMQEAELARVRHIPTTNLTAYDAFLRGYDSFTYGAAASGHNAKEANLQARQMSEKALELDPQYAEAYVLLGWTYFTEWSWQLSPDQQALERALALAQKALALEDSLPTAHGLLGTIYVRKNQYDQALAEIERAVALDPNNADSYAGQANVLNFVGRPADALRAMQQAMRLNPHYPGMYLIQLGRAYQWLGRYKEAIAAYQQLLARNPNFLPAYQFLTFSYLSQWAFQLSLEPQTLAQALAAAQRSLALNETSGTHATLGYVYLWQKQYDQALAEIERAVALAPNEAGNYAILAEVLSRVGRVEDALKAAEQALHLQASGGLDQHLFLIGNAYYFAGKPEEAIAPLKQYLSRYPNILAPHLTLAAVYSELGKDAEARAEAAEVLRLNPKFSLEVQKERAPIKDSATLARQIAVLRRAGLK